MYVDAAGPVGRGLDTAFGTGVGWARLLVPVLALAASACVLVRRAAETEPDREPGAAPTSGSAGCLVAIAAAGLLHLAGGRPAARRLRPTTSPTPAGCSASPSAGPLASGLAPWGAGLVLGAVALAGLVVLTTVPVRVAAESTANGVRPAGTAVAGALRRARYHLFSLRRRTTT